jgi:hypothetical protein
MLAYIIAHPLAVSRLFVLRLGHYLFAYSPGYSFLHRLVNIVVWPVLYLLAGIGLGVIGSRSMWAAGLTVLWVTQAGIVMLTVGDSDGRYSLYAVPALLPFVAAGVIRCFDEFTARLRIRA